MKKFVGRNALLMAVAVLMVIAMPILQACSTLGIPSPQTLDQKLAAAESAVIAAQQVILTAATAGQITSAQATNANNLSLAALQIIATAKGLEITNATGAQNDLTLALASITSIQQYLTSAGAKSP